MDSQQGNLYPRKPLLAMTADGWIYAAGRAIKSIDMKITLSEIDPMTRKLVVSFTAEQDSRYSTGSQGNFFMLHVIH